MTLKYASREDLQEALNPVLPIVDPMTNHAYEVWEEKEWKKGGDNPHGELWHTSFHASRFPADENACPRQAMYEFLDIPGPEPIGRSLRSMGDVGKAVERDIIARWDHMGWLLSPPPDAELQLQAIDSDIWLSSSFDSVVLWPGWDRPFPVEIKTKGVEHIKEMKQGNRGPDEKHIRQLKVQLGFGYLHSQEWWPELKPVEDGALYYLARDNPSIAHEFRFKVDFDFMEKGAETLKEWKQYFLDQEIPQFAEKKHPMGEDWGWSKGPCKYCPMKKHACKPDFQEKTTDLARSNAIGYAERVRENYDFETTYQTVIDRWLNTTE